jgi:enamine deaminase RidA (YjgF/YER057c/UK114 family)
VLAAFPKSAVSVMQLQRFHARGLVECEAVAQLSAAPSAPLQTLNTDSLPLSKNYSHAILVSAPKLAISGLQMAFEWEESDARLAFQRLEKDLQAVNASPKAVVMSNIYPLSVEMRDIASKIRFEFYDRSQPPASTMLLFEGLPSLDASFGVEVIAVAGE